MKGLKPSGFRVCTMQNVFEALKDRFGMGPEPMYYHQTKAKRIAAAAAYISQKVLWKMPLRMSVIDIYNAALIYRAVHPGNEVIYNGRKEFDEIMHDQRYWYSIKIAHERGIETSKIQEEVITGRKESLEANILRMAETMVELRYSVNDKKEFCQVLTTNDKISDKLFKLVGVDAIKYWWEYEEMLQIEIDRKILLS